MKERSSMERLVIASPVGKLGLIGENGFLTGITFDETRETTSEEAYLRRAAEELSEYFEGKRREFDIPYVLSGSPFYKKCLEALIKVPYGSLISYGELAALAGSPRAARAVGNAVHNNPLPILIPCHRVIAGDGSIGGFGGGLDKKRTLLRIEGVKIYE